MAELRPAPDPPQREVVTAVRAPAEAQPLAPVQPANLVLGPSQRPAGAVQPAVAVTWPAAPDPAHAAMASPAVAPSRPMRPPDEIEPLTADLRRLPFTVSKRFLAKLEAARDALSHSRPAADAEAILEAALDLPEAPRTGSLPMPPERASSAGAARSEEPRSTFAAPGRPR